MLGIEKQIFMPVDTVEFVSIATVSKGAEEVNKNFATFDVFGIDQHNTLC